MTCRVAFVPKSFVAIFSQALDGRIVEVTELLKESQWESEKKRSSDSFGIALGIIIG